MRIGENPTKFVRKHQHLATIPVKVPEKITACTVTYVPNLIGYYEDGLNILRLTLRALRKNTSLPFDLMVFDNGSCPEVIEFLLNLQQENVIQWLVLSSENMKKLGAWNHLFTAAQGDYVYYFDSDIYHFPNWLEGMMATLNAFPSAGMVGAFHNISSKHVDGSVAIVRRDQEIKLERGSFIPEDKLLEIGRSLGTDPDDFLRKKSEAGQYRVTRGSDQAYLGVSHCQFLVRSRSLRQLFPQPPDWALSNKDKDFDRLTEEHGWLRLTSTQNYVYHLGNVLEERWREEATRMDASVTVPRDRPGNGNRWADKLLSLPAIRRVLLRAYAFLFNLVYRMR